MDCNILLTDNDSFYYNTINKILIFCSFHLYNYFVFLHLYYNTHIFVTLCMNTFVNIFRTFNRA